MSAETKKGMKLFVDGSAHPQRKIGYGAMLCIEDDRARTVEDWKSEVHTMRFCPTTASRLELETLLWALERVETVGKQLTVFTDSQTIVGLPSRRQSLEQKGFRSSKGRELANGDLYQNFYYVWDRLQFELCKVKGHSPTSEKTENGELFAIVDRAARDCLRSEIS